MIPRILIAGTNSGAGKTTVATGLIGALAAAGHTVQGFKVGPDFIDPSYHALASGRPGRNLDAFLSGPELISPLFRHGSAGAEVAVIEGVMGLFDGASGRGELASSAHVAKLLDAPVLLVVNGGAMARSAAAVIHGFVSFDPAVRVAGVIFNQVGSAGHEALLREAAEVVGVPVLGALRRSADLAVPERHLGLVPAAERDSRNRELLGALAAAVAEQVDLEAVLALARSAPEVPGDAWSPGAAAPGETTDPVRVAVARGPAFSFHYQENLELLEAAGAELVGFDPTVDERLPPGTGALVLAGGFPEVYGQELAANAALREEIAGFSGPVVAECGGLLYLGAELDGRPMCGRLPLRGEMTTRLHLGYREATAATATPWLAAGTAVRGHEFHYSEVRHAPEVTAAWTLAGRARASASAGVAAGAATAGATADGIADGQIQAGYLHMHWAAHPEIPAGFVAATRRAEAAGCR